MACQTPLPLSQTLASEMTLFAIDESLSLLMESATEAGGRQQRRNTGGTTAGPARLLRGIRGKGRQHRELYQVAGI